MKHIITLKNNKKVSLEWTFEVLDYLDNYPGGYEQLQKDYKNKVNTIRVNNYFLYACIAANMDEPISYHELLKLVDIKSYHIVQAFVKENDDKFADFKKKDQAYFIPKQKKHKK